jgi:hypothetical protein
MIVPFAEFSQYFNNVVNLLQSLLNTSAMLINKSARRWQLFISWYGQTKSSVNSVKYRSLVRVIRRMHGHLHVTKDKTASKNFQTQIP